MLAAIEKNANFSERRLTIRGSHHGHQYATLFNLEKPSTGEDIIVDYNAEHDFLDDDDTDTKHLTMLVIYADCYLIIRI